MPVTNEGLGQDSLPKMVTILVVTVFFGWGGQIKGIQEKHANLCNALWLHKLSTSSTTEGVQSTSLLTRDNIREQGTGISAH